MIKEPVIILANGNYPRHKVPKEILNSEGFIVCCDGAINKLIKEGIEPNAIVGDLDSIEPNLKDIYKNKLFHIPDQSDNDLRKVIKWLETYKIIHATILGATGLRDDHCLANISTLAQFPTQINFTMVTDYGKFNTLKGEQIFDSFYGEQVSIFSFDPTVKITTHGLKYNLNNRPLTSLYYGSLNYSIKDTFKLSISHGKILIYQAFQIN